MKAPSRKQAVMLAALLDKSMESGFGKFYRLESIAKEHGVEGVIYDNNHNAGILWEFGPHGSGLIDAQGDWPDAIASVAFQDLLTIQRAVNSFVRGGAL